jgi:restriction system protein
MWLFGGSALAYLLALELNHFHFDGTRSSKLFFLFDVALHSTIAWYSGWSLVGILLFQALLASLRKNKEASILRNHRTVEEIRAMSWQDFERLVGQAYRKIGWRVEETGLGGADGGIDLVMHRGREKVIVQCKRYTTTSIGAKIVREMYGLMMHHDATGVKIVCIGKFTRAAIEFTQGKPIELVGANDLTELIAFAMR